MNNINVTNKYFFCYSINLFRHIRDSGIQYISKGINPSTGRSFWLFERTDELNDKLTEWKYKLNKI
jgi:hypothetical protein